MEDSAYLGTEREARLLAKFAIPCILSLIISCLYNIVDQIFVGHGVGPLANAATGVVFPVTVVGWGLSLFFGDGAAAFLSIALGKKEPGTVHKCVANAVLGTFVSGCALILAAYLWGDGLLMLLGGTDANIGYAHAYAAIIYAMMPLALVQSCLASIIRADGSPRYAMLAMTVGAALNIIGDPIAIYGLGLGIAGAAWATVVGQFVSFVLCACYLFRSKTFRLTARSFVPDLRILGHVCRLGLSSLFTQLCIVATTVANNVLFVRYGAQWNAEYGGDVALAAFVVIMKLFQIVINVAIGLAAGAQPLVGYNCGARRYDRVRRFLRLVLCWTGGLALAFTALFELLPGACVAMFGGTGGDGAFNALYVEFAIPCLRIYMMLITLGCLQKVCAIFLQSMGLAALAAPLSFLRDVLVIVFACVLPLRLGVMGVVWAAPFADATAFLATVPAMIVVLRRLRAPAAESNAAEREQAVPLSD